MPDWLTHILIALIISGLLGVKKKSLVVLGALLPDLIVKSSLLGFFVHLPNTFNYMIGAFHTPIMSFLLSMAIAPLFKFDYLKTLLLINIGLVSHISADLLMRHFDGGQMLFYPFSFKPYTLNVLWAEKYYLVLVPALVLYLLIKYYRHLQIPQRKKYGDAEI